MSLAAFPAVHAQLNVDSRYYTSMLGLSLLPLCLQTLTGCTSIASLFFLPAQASSSEHKLFAATLSEPSLAAYTHTGLHSPFNGSTFFKTTLWCRAAAAPCCSPYSQRDVQQVSNYNQQSCAEFLLALSLRFVCCRQLFLQTPFRHEIHSDVQERIQEAFETGCEFREIAACFTQQGDIVTFQLLFLPVRRHRPICVDKN